MSWSSPVPFDVACRRAGGRRRYLAHRRFLRDLRRQQVCRLLNEDGGLKRGSIRRIAAKLGVCPKTISRDVIAVLCTHSTCPTCGAFVPNDKFKRLGLRS
jgi:hypothetical protein